MGRSSHCAHGSSGLVTGRALPVLGLVAAGVVGLAPAAWADVSVTPTRAEQGSGIDVRLLVTNDRPGTHTTKVEVRLPEESPVAEVYPMSVPDWTPQTFYRQADQPLPGIHASGLTTATTAVIWTRATPASSFPAVEELHLEMGPMPRQASYTFTVIQTYADGTVKRWQGPTAAGGTSITLTPASPESSEPADSGAGTPLRGGHQAHGQAIGPDQSGAPAVPSAAPAVTGDPAASSSGVRPMLLIATGTLGASLAAVVGMLALVIRNVRRRSAATETLAPSGALAPSPLVQQQAAATPVTEATPGR